MNSTSHGSNSNNKKTLFFLRAFNDLDHFSPIANLYLEQEILVTFSFTEKFISGEDPRLSVLNRHKSFSSNYFSLLDLRVVEKISILGRAYKKFCLDGGKVRNAIWFVIFIFCFPIIFLCYFFYLRSPNVIFTDWSTPYSRGICQWSIFKMHRLFKRPIFAIPHGVNIYVNDDVTESYNALNILNKNIDFMRMKDRNWFDAYIVQYREKMEKWRDLGLNNLLSLGSLRFSRGWIKLLHAEVLKPKVNNSANGSINVVFFDHQKDYRICKEKIIHLLEQLAECKDIQIYMKESTRLNKSYYTLDDLSYLRSLGIIFSELDSISLISKCDLVINYGSSIVLEAIVQNKPFINPTFCHENKTIIEKYVPSATADSSEEVLQKLRNGRKFNIWFSQKEANHLLDVVVLDGQTDRIIRENWLELVV